MSKKDDLKVVFDFIADYLRDEKPVDKVKEPKTKTQTDKNVEHMLEIMKRVDVRDKIRRTTPVVPQNERDSVDSSDDTISSFGDVSLVRETASR